MKKKDELDERHRSDEYLVFEWAIYFILVIGGFLFWIFSGIKNGFEKIPFGILVMGFIVAVMPIIFFIIKRYYNKKSK